MSHWKKPNFLGKPIEHAEHVFAHLSQHQKYVLQLNALVKPVFQKHASMDISVARYDRGILTIATENLTAANHLNYLHRIFLDELKTLPEFHELTSLSFICIDKPTQRYTKATAKVDSMSDKSRELVKKSACMIRDNPELSHALHQLSNKK